MTKQGFRSLGEVMLVVVAGSLILPATSKGQEPETGAGQLASSGVLPGKYFHPLQLGLLSPHGGSQPNSFSVGTGRTGVASDGANIWVTNGGSATVTKL